MAEPEAFLQPWTERYGQYQDLASQLAHAPGPWSALERAAKARADGAAEQLRRAQIETELAQARSRWSAVFDRTPNPADRAALFAHEPHYSSGRLVCATCAPSRPTVFSSRAPWPCRHFTEIGQATDA